MADIWEDEWEEKVEAEIARPFVLTVRDRLRRDPAFAVALREELAAAEGKGAAQLNG